MAYTTIDDPSAYFKIITFTGDESTPRAHTFSDTDTDMQPDLVWLKKRNTTEFHVLTDAVRGAGKMISSNNADGEASNSNSGYISAFGSDGFTTTNGTENELYVNTDGATYVGWCWKESATSGFDIVTWTGNETARTISHSLSAVPNAMFVKCRNVGHGWVVYHSANTSAPETDLLVLNGTDATTDSNTRWNDTAPTSSVFTVGTSTEVNQDTKLFVGYLFSDKQGFSKCGSYIANEDDEDGPYIHLGFRAAWIMIKRTSTAGKPWAIMDNKRLGYNVDNNVLNADDDAGEHTNDYIDICANGFKIRDDNADVNKDAGETYIYMAFAEAPFVNSNGVPCNAR